MVKKSMTTEDALTLLEESPGNIFITGKAGTGKSTLLEKFRNSTSKKIAVLAPTGVAAINVKGQTIHSFFKFSIDVHPDRITRRKSKSEIYKNLDAIVIDEISMVRADLLDCIDIFLRLNGPFENLPFGGIRVIFFGDLYQLPPVLRNEDSILFFESYRSPYFFDAKCMSEINLDIIELDTIFRQKDKSFISILNAIRDGSFDLEMLDALNVRFNPDAKFDIPYVYLTTTNAKADGINNKYLSAIKKKEVVYEGDVFGEFPEKDFPASFSLVLKVGAQVMLLANDYMGRYVNGSIGEVLSLKEDEVEVLIDGKKRLIERNTWEKYVYTMNEETGKVESKVVGSYTQFPIRLAWAMTIHKSQGKTFEHVVIDFAGGAFAHGQAYVALSRATSLEGIVLTRKIYPRDIIVEERIVDFMHT